MDKETYRNQLQTVFKAFREKPKTRLQVATETNILRGNICWFVRDLKQEKKITVTKKDRCPVSRHQAEFLTTKPEIVEKAHGGKG